MLDLLGPDPCLGVRFQPEPVILTRLLQHRVDLRELGQQPALGIGVEIGRLCLRGVRVSQVPAPKLSKTLTTADLLWDTEFFSQREQLFAPRLERLGGEPVFRGNTEEQLVDVMPDFVRRGLNVPFKLCADVFRAGVVFAQRGTPAPQPTT